MKRDGQKPAALTLLRPLQKKTRQPNDNTHSELAPETASTYFRYGEALLRAAQSDVDVFGGRVREAAEERARAEKAAANAEGRVPKGCPVDRGAWATGPK